MRLWSLLALLSAAVTAAAANGAAIVAEPLPPLKEGVWIRYEGGSSAGIPPGTVADWFFPLMSVRYDGVRGESMLGRLRTPTEEGPTFEFPRSYRAYRGEQLTALFSEEPYLLFRLLDHYRPDVVFETSGGSTTTETSAMIEAHRQCRQRLHEQYLPASTRREDDVPLSAAAALLQIRALPLEVSALSTERLMEEARWPSWLSDRIRSHGLAFEYVADMKGEVSPVASALCTPNTAAGDQNFVSDQCRISGILDREDGWPLRLSTSRSSRTVGGMTFHNGLFLTRRPAYPIATLPGNPCSDAVAEVD